MLFSKDKFFPIFYLESKLSPTQRPLITCLENETKFKLNKISNDFSEREKETNNSVVRMALFYLVADLLFFGFGLTNLIIQALICAGYGLLKSASDSSLYLAQKAKIKDEYLRALRGIISGTPADPEYIPPELPK